MLNKRLLYSKGFKRLIKLNFIGGGVWWCVFMPYYSKIFIVNPLEISSFQMQSKL